MLNISSRVNYVVAAWTGGRRNDPINDSFYIDTHIKTLELYKHSLSQITIVFPEGPSNFPEIVERYSKISKIGDTPVVIITRENDGLSYGSWSATYDKYESKFDYYIFIEDDYVFVRDNFDSIMVNMINSSPSCGFLCSFYDKHRNNHVRNWKPHAGVSNGIARSDVLARVKERFGKLPYVSGPGYRFSGQVLFSNAFLKVGYFISDIMAEYRCPYFDENTKTVQDYAPNMTEYLMKPVQMVASR